MSTERLLWALAIAAVPTVVGVVLGPSNVYGRLVVGLGVLVATFPAAYLVAGVRA